MSNIYVPIDYSDVKNVIPQGEDIIYSTLCKATIDKSFGPIINKTKWLSHVLMTEKGIAFSVPQKKKPTEFVYVPWYEIYHTWNDGIFLRNLTEMLIVTRDPNFESKEKFKERRLKACIIFLPLLIKEKEKFLNSPENANIDKRKRRNLESSLRHNYKLYNNMKKKGRI